MHNRKLLALAVAGTLGVPLAAYADTANVNVYGKLYPQYQTGSAHGATQPGDTVSSLTPAPTVNNSADGTSHQSVESTNSYIGFKGEADAGGGMKGWFQIEQSVLLDVGTGTFSSRNSAAGISGAFGNVFLGNWDTVYKQLGDPVSFLGISSGNIVSTSNVLSKQPFGTSSTGSFHLRRANNLEYDSPSIGGAQVMVNYSPDEAKTQANGGKNAYLYDIGVKWESGPLYVALMRETHNDFFGGSNNATNLTSNATGNGTHSKDVANRVSAKFKFGGTEVGGDVAQMEYKERGQLAAGRFDKYKHMAFSLVGTQQLGNLQFAVAYVQGKKGSCTLSGGTTCVTDGLDAKNIDLGVKYDFSKRVSVFGIYSKIANGKSAQANNQTITVNPGADPEAFAAGVIVSF